MILQGILMIWIFVHFVNGLHMRYKDDFNRKIFAYDPVKNEYKYVMNDGEVKVENGQVVG